MRRMPMMVLIVIVYFLVRNWNGDILPLVVLGGIAVVGVLGYRAYQSRTDRRRADDVERAEVASLTEMVQSQLSESANRILDVEGRPGLAMSPAANEHFQKAVVTFVAVDEKLPAAVSRNQLQAILTDLDDALWRLAAAEALLDGEDLPKRPGSATQAVAPPIAPTSLPVRSRDAVTRWSDGRSGGGRHHRKRSC